MPTTQDGSKTGSAARAEAADDNSYVSKDTFTNPALTTLANTATAEDPQGVERIVVPGLQPFTPAPLEATDEQKARMESLNGTLDKAKAERLEALKAKDVPSEDRAANEQANAGSQTGVTSGGNQTTGQANEAKAETAAKAAEKKDKG